MATINITDAELDLAIDGVDYLNDLLVIDSNIDFGDDTDFAMDMENYEWYRDRIADAKRILAALEGEERTQFIDEVLVHEFTDDTISDWLERTGC